MPKHLLLADDSITIQKVVGITFAGEDFTLTAVDNGEEALARARAQRPDLILADVVMPRLNGYELCERVKGDPDLKDVPVLLLAGTFEAFDEARARAARADGHIAKPFESGALIAKVRELTGAPAAAAGAAAPHAPTPRAAPAFASPRPAPAARPAPTPAPRATAFAPPPTGKPPLPQRPPTGPAAPRPGSAAPAARPAPLPPLAVPPPAASHAARAARLDPFGAPRPTPAPFAAPPKADPFELRAGPVVKPAPGPTDLFDVRGAEADLLPAAPPEPAAPQPKAEPPAPAAAPEPAPRAAEPVAADKPVTEAAGELAPLPESFELDWSDLNEEEEAPAAAAPTPVAAPAPAAAPAAVAAPGPLPAAVPVPAARVAPLDDLDFGEPPPASAEPRRPLSTDAAPEPEVIELSLLEAEEVDLETSGEFELPAAEPPVPVPAAGAPAAAAVTLLPASDPAAPLADGGEARLREALSQASREVLERVAWEVVPQLAEAIIREHVERLAKARHP